MRKERCYYLDAIRVLACVMVIVMHSPIPQENMENSLFLGILSYFTAPCIGLFFMVSGALLLPIREDSITFLRKRLNKVIFPTLFWSLFYIICNLLTGKINGIVFVKALLGIPFTAQGNGVLWFMYTLIGLYLLAPVLSSWLDRVNEKTIKLYLGFWLITLCYPFVRLVLNIPSGEENVLFYFSGYAGYFVLGYYLANYVSKQSISKKYYFIIMIGVCVVLFPPILCKVNHWDIDFYSLFWYLSIGVVLMCVGWFIMLQKIFLFGNRNRITNAFADISKMSFGIYLIHIFIMRSVLWNLNILQSLPYILQIPLCAILTFGLSYLIIKSISKFPFSKYIIGC